jgi:CheY-like chemotaxis protein
VRGEEFATYPTVQQDNRRLVRFGVGVNSPNVGEMDYISRSANDRFVILSRYMLRRGHRGAFASPPFSKARAHGNTEWLPLEFAGRFTLACTGRPDAVVVDAVLPDSDGLNLCGRLVANPSTFWIPLIVVTGDDAAYRRALTMPSVDAARKKPCPVNELLALLLFAVSIRRVQ